MCVIYFVSDELLTLFVFSAVSSVEVTGTFFELACSYEYTISKASCV